MIPWQFLYHHHPEAFKPLKPFSGSIIEIDLPPVKQILQIEPSGELFTTNLSQMPTTRLSGSFSDLGAYLLGNHQAISLEGNLRLAHALQKVLALIQSNPALFIDGILGDTLSSFITPTIQAVKQSVKSTLTTTAQDTAEHLQFESQVITPAHLINDYCDKVDALRHRIARFEAKLSSLEKSENHE